MAHISGYLRPLRHSIDAEVEYVLATDSDEIPLRQLLNQAVTIRHNGQKACIACGRKVNKLFQNGYCFPCVRTLAECDLCIVKPHECHFHLGTCRDESFAKVHCMIPHYVYLALSSGVKVGLTRKGRQLTRWVDQGAVSSILLAELPTRKQAGELEMEIAKHLPDKTNWRRMLKGDIDNVDLLAVRSEVISRLPSEWHQFLLPEPDGQHHFHYPIAADFEPNLTSLTLDKTPEFNGTVRGAKAQYVLLDTGVFHVKKHAGYYVEMVV